MLRNKRVRLFLAVFMLPLSLVLVTSGAANAVTSELLTVEMGDGSCVVPLAVNAVTGGSTVIVGTGGYCKGGPDGTPGFCSLYEAPCTVGTISVQTQTGDVCGSAGWEGISSSGTISKTLMMGSASIPIADCDPVQICVTLTADPSGPFGGSTSSGCAATGLDPAVEPPSAYECVNGSVGAVPRSDARNHPGMPYAESVSGGTSHKGWWDHDTAQMVGDPAATAGAWVEYAIIRNAEAPSYLVSFDGTSVPVHINARSFAPGVTLTSDPWRTEVAGIDTEINVDAQTADDVVIGRGVYWAPTTSADTRRRIQVGTSNTAGLIGITDSARCSWYWGDVVANRPEDTTETPIGPVATAIPPPTVTDPPPVPPPDPDPTSGLDFGWLAALLGKLIDAVTGLVGAILDGLKALFIPSQGFLDNRINNLSGAWDNTAIGKLGTALGDITPGGVSGCGGMPLVVDFGNGVTISESIGAACSGPMASAAGMVRMALSAVLVLGGAVACVRAVGSGFGWNPGIGQGSSS